MSLFFSPLFSFYYYFLFVCFFLSLFFLISINYLFFFICEKKICIYRSKLSLDWEKHYLCLHSWCNRISIYGVLISCMCIFDLDVDAKRIYFCNKPNIFYKKLTKEYESIFAYVCVYLCIFAIFLHAYRWISYYTISPESNEKLQNFFYNFHSLCHLALISFILTFSANYFVTRNNLSINYTNFPISFIWKVKKKRWIAKKKDTT